LNGIFYVFDKKNIGDIIAHNGSFDFLISYGGKAMKKIALIHLPVNPLWKVCKTFGTDELISLVANFLATIWFTYYLATESGMSFLLSVGLSVPAGLALAGPVLEKVGFFPMHFWEAWTDYRTTPLEDRKSRGSYLSGALKGGSVSMIEDILIHDPFYFGLMYFGLRTFAGTPPWILCLLSFGGAVLVVGFLEVGTKEVLHRNAKRKLKMCGFQLEKYYEARFCYSDETIAEKVFRSLAQKYVFSPPYVGTETSKNEAKLINYHDRYFAERSWWNSRTMLLRSRDRDDTEKGKMRSWQVVYTLINETWKQGADQYRYFVSLKEKMYYLAPEGLLHHPDQIADKKVRETVAAKVLNESPVDVRFERLVAQRFESLLVSFDRVHEHSLYIIEIKARPDRKQTLKEAMRYAMLQGGLQTTHGKYRLLAGSS